MRLRNIPGADEVVSQSPYCIQDPAEHKGRWNEVFSNDHPIHMEIGMGKGRFLMELARLNPDINYIGVERYTSVLLRAVQKMETDPLPNLFFLCIDAADLPEYFEKAEIKRIYLNFSDPWPKDRHAKRRLTSPEFLARYKEILDEDGRIEFKTDNVDLFSYSLETIQENEDWELKEYTHDLHHDETMNSGNIMTEYEEKFSSQGNRICKLIATRLLAFFLVLVMGVTAAGAQKVKAAATDFWPTEPEISTPNAIVMELNTGAVLYEKGADEQHYPASITKILTTLLAIENCDMDEVVTFSDAAVDSAEGSGIARDYGEQMTMEECLYAVMLESANECAYAVAEHVGEKLGGDYQTFIDMMNERAKELGCTNTHFNNCNGLPDPDHYTSARDMALIAQEAYKNETFRIIISTKNYTIPPTNKHSDPTYLSNHHDMLHYHSTSAYIYDGCTGGKTGYTTAANHTLVTYAERDGMALVCVVMNTAGSNHYIDTISLFDYCFDNFEPYNISENESRIELNADKTYGLLNDEEAFVALDTEACIVLPKTVDFTETDYSWEMEDEDGGTLAELIYSYAGRRVGSAKLVESGAKVSAFPLEESVGTEEEETDVKVVKVNLWYVLFGFLAVAALGAIIYFIVKLIRNFYVIKHSFERKRAERSRFKEIKTKKKKYRRRDSMFR